MLKNELIKKKKVLLLARSLDTQKAGIHIYAENLIEYLEDYGDHETFDYTIARAADNTNMTLSKINQVFFGNKFKFPGFASLRLFFLVPLYANKNNYDAVIELSHFGPFNLKKKIKRITVIHDLTPVLHSNLHSFRSSFLQKLFLPKILNKADLIISNSKNTQTDISNTYPNLSTPSSYIYLGINKHLSKDNNSKTNILQKYSMDTNFILYLGTIEPRKNLVTLLKAFDYFKEKTKSKVLLVLAGKQGWKNQEFFDVLNKSKFKEEVKLLGYIDREDIQSMYKYCEVFVYPSLYEGFGFPIVEALDAGAQVICAENSSLVEFGEEFVSYFDTFDHISLSKKLEEVLIQKKTKKINLVKLREKYNWKSYVYNFEKELKAIL